MLSIRTAAKRRFAATLIALALIVMTTAVPAWAAACSANVCTIATGADLVSALTTIDGDPTNAYTVNFAANVTLDTTTTLPYIASTSTVTINGNGFTLDGGGVQRGFFANTGTISISSLTISNTLAQGGNGGEGFRTGGGGAGLGGAIFVAAGASVAISGVSLTTNKAAGGHGGDFCCGGSSALASGGGGMGGDGGNGAPANGGETGGGGLGLGATGAVVGGTGSAGIATGAASGGTGTSGRAAGANGGGGSADVTFGDDAAGGGGIGGHNSSGMNGGAGGFGGGGGGGENNGGAGGFGGGGGTGFDGSGGNGGFGGGGGADAGSGSPGAGGFGGGAGSSAGGGGGLGAGGAIFVQQGGTLTVSDAVAVTGNTVAAGRQSNFEGTLVGSPGAALGSGIFLQGNGTLGFTPNGATQTIANAIADQTGNGGSGGNTGVYAVTITGPGTVALTGANSYSGGTTVTGAVVQVSADSGFGKASGAVTLGGGSTLQITGGAFSSARSYIISGTGANAESFDTNGNNATFSGTISGAGDFDKIGIGTLTLSHLGTYSGATVVNAGTLKAGAANVLPTGTTLNVGSAGTFDTSTFNQTFNQLIGSGSVVMTGGGATLTVGGDNADTEFDGVLSGAGTFAKTGTGALTLTGANINTGTTTLSAGTIRAGNASVFSSSSAFNVTSTGTLDLAGFNESVGSLAGAGAVTLGSGTLTTSGNASTTFSGSIGGTGGLTKAGTGTFTLSGSDGYSGATTVSGGALTAAVANAFGVNSAVTIATGATLNLNNFSQSIGSLAGSGAASLGSATLTTGTDNTNTTFGGTITGAGAFVKTGTGTLTLASASAYTGTTSVSGGTLQAGAANVFASPSAYTIGGSGTLDLNNFNQTLSSLGGSGNITLGTATLTLATATNPVFAGNISGSGGLTTTGSGVFTLSGSNAYTGATVLGSATLRAGAANAFSAGSQIVTTGATLDLNGFDQTIGSLSGNGTVTLGSGQLTLGADNTSTTFGGTITGSGNLAKTGTGTFTLATASAYTGTTSISGGTLQAGAASVFVSPSAYTIGGSGTLDLNNFNQTLSSLGGSGNITLGSATLTLATATNPVFAGSISGSGGLTTTGSGIFTLSGSNAYTGATVLGSATLRAGAANAFSAGSQIVMAGATLDLSGFDQTIGSLSGNGTVSLGSANLFTGNDNTTTTLGGSISGSGSLIKNGTGTFTLSGANAYTGSTLVMNGTLQAGAAGAFAAGSTYGVDTNGTLALNGNSQTVGSLFGTGAVALGSATLTTGGDNTGTTFAGTISGSGGVTKAGSGSFVFNGTGSYTGTTEVQNGIFMVGDANNAGASLAGNVTIDPNGTLRGHGTIAGSIINNGILMPGGSIGTLTVASYAQSANGTLASEVAPAGSDKLNVIGNAAIDGTLALAFDPGFSPTQSFTLLDAGSITGQFANVTTTGASSLIATHLVYSAGAITLQLAPQLGLLTAIARTPNQQAVGNAFINAQNSPNADFTAALTAFETLPSNAAVLNALDAVSGVEHTATPVVALDNAFEFARMLQAHARDAGTGGWFQYDGGTNALIGNSNAPGYTVSMNGASAGFDGTAGNVHSGLAVASDRTNVATSNAMSSHATLDRSTLAAYAADNLGGVTLSAEIGLGTLHFASSDPIAFGSVQRSATGAAGGSEFTSALDARYNLRFGAATIAPHAGIAYANIGRDAFTETGAGALGLSVAATGVSIARSDAGLEVDLGGRGLHGSVRTDWLHDLSPISSPITAQFAGVGSASTLTIYGVTPARDAAVLGGTLAEPIGKFELFADVDANLSSNQTEESFDGGLRVRW